MEIRIIILWVLGLIVIVPYSIYSLLFTAQPDQYAFLIVAPLFWIFGFWGVVGPLIAAWRVHRLMSALDKAGSSSELREAYENNAGKEVVIDLIASENRIPKFIARRLYTMVVKRLKQKLTDSPAPQSSDFSQ